MQIASDWPKLRPAPRSCGMVDELVFIGFGEAGRALAPGPTPRAYDIDPARRTLETLAEALDGASAIISVVTADQALKVAREAASCLKPGAFYFDMNSVAPGTKLEAATAVEAAGGCYADVAVMSPVLPRKQSVPLFISGPHGELGAKTLGKLGFTDVRVVGETVGRAATIKMLRSVVYKGMEALTAECLLGCQRAGVSREVLASFGEDWETEADYRLDRMLVHGLRRAAEMAEAATTLNELGVDPLITSGVVERQAQFGALGIRVPPMGLTAKLELFR